MDKEETPPRVSALIVSCNCAQSLRRCLAALERSRERETIEVIVIDNGSRDESPTLDTEFPNTTFLRLPRNFGLAKALNIAMRSAHAEYLLLLAPEVEVQPETIPGLAACLDARADAVAVSPLLVAPDGSPVSVLQPLLSEAAVTRLAWGGEPAGTLPIEPAADSVAVPFPDFRAILLRKFFIRGLNYFDERYGHHWLDAELAAQIHRAAKQALVLPGIRATCRPQEMSFALSTSARAALAADRALGAATYAG